MNTQHFTSMSYHITSAATNFVLLRF